MPIGGAWAETPVDERDLHDALTKYFPMWRASRLPIPEATKVAIVECFMKAHQPMKDRLTVALFTVMKQLEKGYNITYKDPAP